ncbi:receptor-like kinase TMK4 [Actinia tenebrosa]|uniref:Receptor-like kinase TMK4 n=1 Tax=Actinia tenebrosa TaxID=6105 RepID=A0A6P8IF79_ACTTE|nr:receptor-like kinase TMK4 [Actinia tenebrosa]
MGNIASNDNVKLCEKIGEGSYGEVYRGVWKGRQVAAKKLRSFFFENDFFCLQNKGRIFNDLKKEWEIMSGLKHKNIVEYLTVIMPQEGSPIIVTELCTTDLFHFIRKESNCKVLFSDAVSIMLNVAEGLDYLHGLKDPVIHRDLSSKNILIKDLESKEAKIADMGLSKVFPNGAMYATPGVGCIIYAAPETYPEKLGRGRYSQKAYYTEKVDIFSFGAVLLEVIVGRLPDYLPNPILEDGEVLPEYIRRSKEIYDMGPDHPLRDLVISCLDNAPQDRPDARGLVEFLTSFKLPEKVDVPSPGSSYKSAEQSIPISRATPMSVERVMTRGYDYGFKVVVLGTPGVGKTSIIQRFLHPEMEMDVFRPTIDPGDYFERLQIRGKTVHLHIVDTPGEVKSLHHSALRTTPLVYRGVNGVALVCDVGCRISFNQLPQWLQIVRDRCSPETPVVVVCNQTDKPQTQWKVSSGEAEAWALNNDLFYIETSAKGLINIDEIFTILIEKMIQQRLLNEPSCSNFGTNPDDTWVSGISSRSLLKNSTPNSYGIPAITEKTQTRPLPPAESIRVEFPATPQGSIDQKNKGKCCKSS